jgi:hypothetical protein
MGTDADAVVSIIPREAVFACDTEQILLGLSVFVRSKGLAPQVQGHLRLAFEGFDNDPRELWEIPEVRLFMERLDAVFPYWFFLADLNSATLHLIASCLCRVSEVAPGFTLFDSGDLAQFMGRQFHGMNQLWAEHQLSEELNRSVSDQILAIFDGRASRN